ncbi:chitinase, partial [Phenoliferia sp. Uapishka_3]
MVFSTLPKTPLVALALIQLLGFASEALATGVVIGASPNLGAATSSLRASPVVAQYWPAWSATQSAQNFPWSSTDIAYYFVVATTSTGIQLPPGQSSQTVKSFVAEAKAHNVKAVFSVGGWNGGIYFSQLVGYAGSRASFAQSIQDFMDQYDFDGVDIDWEYPNHQGIGCNIISPMDSSNLLAFLHVLRTTVGASKLITAAVSPKGYCGSDGNALDDLSPFAKYLDYINLMAVSVPLHFFHLRHFLTPLLRSASMTLGNIRMSQQVLYLRLNLSFSGAWDSTTGPNSPLETCDAAGSVLDGVKVWTDRGFPAPQILVGIPSYGISWTTTTSMLKTTYVDGFQSLLYQPVDKSNGTPQGDANDVFSTAVDVCGNPGTGYTGHWTYKTLISGGILSSDGSKGMGGFTRHFDSCTQTPFLYNPSTRDFISYDDGQSASSKASYVQANGLGGVFIYDSTGFTTDVLSSIRTTLEGY